MVKTIEDLNEPIGNSISYEQAQDLNFPLISSIPKDLFEAAFSDSIMLEKLRNIATDPKNLFREANPSEINIAMLPTLFYDDEKPQFLIRPILKNIPLISQLTEPVRYDYYGRELVPTLNIAYPDSSSPSTLFRKEYYKNNDHAPSTEKPPIEKLHKRMERLSLQPVHLDTLRFPFFIRVSRKLYFLAKGDFYSNFWTRMLRGDKVMPGNKLIFRSPDTMVVAFYSIPTDYHGKNSDCLFVAQELDLKREVFPQIEQTLASDEGELREEFPTCNYWNQVAPLHPQIRIPDTGSRKYFYRQIQVI